MRLYKTIFILGLVLISAISWKLYTTKTSPKYNIYYQIDNENLRFRDKYSGEWLSIVTKSDFPWLFDNRKLYEMRIIPLTPNNKQHYLLGHVYPDHGGYAYKHFVIIDILNKNKVLYESKKLFNKGIFSNVWILPNEDLQLHFGYHKRATYALSPTYLLYEFISYDNRTNSYITVNTRYKKKIQNVVAGLEEWNGCSVENGGEKVSFTKIKEEFGENYKCRSNDEYFQSPRPGFAGKPYNGIPILNPITPKEYFRLKKHYDNILDNKEQSVFDL